MKRYALPILLTGLVSHSVYAECNISFKYGVVIDPIHVRLRQENQTYVQITRDQQLFVSGREALLTNKQKELLNQYSRSLREQVPQIISIAIEGVDVGLEAVNKAIGGLSKKDSESHRLFQKRFNDMQWNLRNRFNHSDNNYYVAPQSFNDFDEIFSGQFEKEIEHIVTQSLGSILMAVGDAIVERTGREQDRKKDNQNIIINNKMTPLEKELMSELSAQTRVLDQKARIFCSNLRQLDLLEEELRSSIPSLHELDLIGKKLVVKPQNNLTTHQSDFK
ncbi:DUF2884 family protein [Pseudocolwellia agarivorans]|uniref:DUF2884 family protein n=1 Tax=Pseudocolwellia agarivorans TaxID=1911682 RepID=UPI00158D3E54|nr:DUF2884 family protein [Pseudocolwellia agarivorans]